jgi:hypothetical protein
MDTIVIKIVLVIVCRRKGKQAVNTRSACQCLSACMQVDAQRTLALGACAKQ